MNHAKVYHNPANEAWIELTELFEIECANPWVQLTTNEEVIEMVACLAPSSKKYTWSVGVEVEDKREREA